MNKTTLLIVDVQNALLTDDLFNRENVIANIQLLIAEARKNALEIIYIRHDGGAGDTFEKNTAGWEICSDIAPELRDKIIDKQFNSAFKETGLREYLDSKGITDLILTGMQTEYCIDTTCRVAFEFGYRIVIPENCTSTCNNEYFSGESLVKYYERQIWNRRFAEVMPVDEVIQMIQTLEVLEEYRK